MSKHINKIPINRYNDKYTSLIRSIKIFLPPQLNKEKESYGKDDDFVGRERLIEKLFLWLSNKDNKTGSYLVTGFRGMGKTSLVDRTIERLARETNSTVELLAKVSLMVMVVAVGLVFVYSQTHNYKQWLLWLSISLFAISFIALVLSCTLDNPIRKAKKLRNKIPNRKEFLQLLVDRIARGRRLDVSQKDFSNIKISVNLGHEVLKERDILGLIATNVRDKYKEYIKSIQPRWFVALLTTLLMCVVSIGTVLVTKQTMHHAFMDNLPYEYLNYKDVTKDLNGDSKDRIKLVVIANEENKIVTEDITGEEAHTIVVDDNWFSRTAYNIVTFGRNLYAKENTRSVCLLLFYFLCFFIVKRLSNLFVRILPLWGTPRKSISRLNTLVDRIVATTDEEMGTASSMEKSMVSISLFNRRRHKTMPIADIREIETELSSIINDIADKCTKWYSARFLIVFDEMDKIDPAMVEPPKSDEMPEFTDSVKGFPDGMDSRERRRSVLKLLANIKLFVSSAKAKFVFISGRELYDAYLADLSDRDFAISSIFSGVLNVDSFLTPEGGQTDVRSMSEWYIANRLLPEEWLQEREFRNAREEKVLKKEIPSLRWYYEYLIEGINSNTHYNDEERIKLKHDANFVLGFLHTFAAYLTHISNGSPKKIYLYFEKYIRKAIDCVPMNDWRDTCTVGIDCTDQDKKQQVLFFDSIQQKNINFIYYLADPIMGTITNDLSNFGDRFLVSLSFIIDHIYKHHNRSFSWRNLEQIPDLLKTSKAPELRNSVTSIMEYLTQIHISRITIGLNEYKFHKSIAEEISMMSKMSDEASALFNFTLDESLSVIQYNTRLLNYYIELDRKQREHSSEKRYGSIISRIHSNLGDLHYWDEDYYAAALEYRAAIESLFSDKTTYSFLTKLRCMLKLGLTYESRKLYPNCYQIYTRIIKFLVENRWVDEKKFGLSSQESRTHGWKGKRPTLYLNESWRWSGSRDREAFEKEFKHKIFEGDHNRNERNDDGGPIETKFGFNFDETVSTLSQDLTKEKSDVVGRLTLFEEVRYVYQAILAKLSVIEKMDMSGITQTNIDVAEGEFRTIHKSVNVREKFVISADFFRKLAEILYYKNSLTILTQNQDAFYASVYYGDYDLLSNLDDFCLYSKMSPANALTVKHDVRFFFHHLNVEINDQSVGNEKVVPRFDYSLLDNKDNKLKSLFEALNDNLSTFFDKFSEEDLPKDDKKRVHDNVQAFLTYNTDTVHTNKYEEFHFRNLGYCDCHRQKLRKQNLRPPCYACKYYTRSLRILAENMFDDRKVLLNGLSKSIGILKNSFKKKLLYSGSIQVRNLAQTLEGFGNVMFSCSSGDDCEGVDDRTYRGISSVVIEMLQSLCKQSNEDGELQVVVDFENKNKGIKLTRLDKSIMYYWDAYRFYLIDSCYNEAIGCLNKIINMIVYYIEVLHYYNGGEKLLWRDETDAVIALIGNNNFENSFLATLFTLLGRNIGYKYDQTNLTEINELKWIYSLEMHDNINLSRLSLFPDMRAAWLRIVEARAKGLRYLAKQHKPGYSQEDYVSFITSVYPLVAPSRRYETTFYEEVLGYYTKLRFNEHVLNNILGGNVMIGESGYAPDYHIRFFERLADYLDSDVDKSRVDYMLFRIETKDAEKRLEMLEFLIHDTMVCVTDMLKIFAPHVQISSYSNSFVGLVYNFYWEWIRKYEFLYILYQYNDLIKKGDRESAERIIKTLVRRVREKDEDDSRQRLLTALKTCCRFIPEDTPDCRKYGTRADRFYEFLRHDIDDIAITTIFSNYAAEMALKYYKMAEEANTEGQSYKSMIGSLYFLNDDFNNDTVQFIIACDRYLLNCGVVAEQRRKLEEIYKDSNVYSIKDAYINGPDQMQKATVVTDGQFDRSQYINSEY